MTVVTVMLGNTMAPLLLHPYGCGLERPGGNRVAV